MQRADPDRGAPLDQSSLNFDKGNVALFGKQFTDEAAMRFNPARMPVSATWLGNSLTMFQRALPPADRARCADTKPVSRSPTTQTRINRSNDPVPQVL
jgi:hypothetical protein